MGTAPVPPSRPTYAAVNYRLRIIGCLLFGLMLISIYGSGLSTPHFVLLAFMLGWPHLAYWRARRGGGDRRAENFNVLAECILGGVLIPAFGFRLWPVTAMYFTGFINTFLWGGPRYAILGVALSLVGLALALPIFGTEVHLETEPWTIALSLVAMFGYAALIGATTYQLRMRQRETRAALEAEQKRSTELLLNVFPASIVPRLREGESPIADQFADATVIFIDMVEFTPLSERLGPKGMVLLLNELFRKFDAAAARFGVEKIETTGDGYLAVAGAPGAVDHHPQAVADFALTALEATRGTRIGESESVQVRVGIHTGPIFGGVIGETRFHYKIFGETVNVASRIQAHAQAGRILVSEAAYKRIRVTHALEPHATLELKGHGAERTYWLVARA